MSIIVSNLTKLYGSQKAVDDLSFTVGKNEIVGFLGPNGAGKSTTLKIATGYLAPTKGTVEISGISVLENPIEVKKTIGYLPEHNPLYLDMFVHEYLRFSGKFYGIGGNKLKQRTADVIEMCQLQVEQNKKIGQLSKGYRQRVGLAQALLHEPAVLILDEPTTGLDPNQIVEVRDLIKEVSKDRTVIFSTHIMQEVQAVCDRAIIINQGRAVADKSIEELLKQNSSQVLEVEFEQEIAQGILDSVDNLTRIKQVSEKVFILEFATEKDMRPSLMQHMANEGLPLIGIKKKELSMEEVFNSLTKSASDA